MRRTVLVLGLITGVCTAAFGQSLAELAKKTAEQRNANKAGEQKTSDTSAQSSPKKVYTNKDLKDEPASLTVAGSAPAPPADKPSSTAKAEPDEITRAAEYRQTAKKDEAYWKARMRDLQSALDTDQIRLAAMESRVASLSADLNLSGIVTERLALRREREEAATEVARLKAAVLADTKAISTAEEEARRASVPPGWLRP